jgi:hypothetical protein
VGDNNYEEIICDQLPTANIYDCFSVPDADGDGKWEFVLKGLSILDGEIHVFIFEATANNTYEVIQSLTLPGGDYSGGFSDAGDIDGDSIPEIVLEARYNVFILKASSDNSFYIWDTLPGCATGSNIRLRDCDDNGLNEIIISNMDITRGWEYDGGSIQEYQDDVADVFNMTIKPSVFVDKLSIELGVGIDLRNVSLSIYDVTGRLVYDFGVWSTNKNSVVTWSGQDKLGRQLAPGIYFVRLKNEHTGEQRCIKVLKIK